MKAYVELKSGMVLETNDPAMWPEAKRLSGAEGKRRLKTEAVEYLRELFAPGSTVWTKVTHVSRSGMSRNIQAYAIIDNEPRNVSGYVAKALDWPCDREEMSVKAFGCGMDMGFHLVHSLSYALYPESYDCVGPGCPSNEHSNGDRDYSPHRHDKGSAGYALHQRWM